MGLDVYVGSLTRYCTEGPADVVERIARHQGMAVADGQEAEEVIWAAVLRWWENLSRWLGDRLARPLDRDESSPAPCVTDKPGWDGYGGPCCWPPTTSIPSCRPRPWSPPTGPTTSPTSRLGPGGRSRCSQLLTPELWLPCRFEFTVHTQDLTGEEVELGSGVALLEQLELLAARYRLEADPPEVGGDGHSLSAAAGNGLAVLRRLGARSVRSRVSMKLDF